MIVLDTTILAYAVGDEHPLRAPCLRLLAPHGEGRIEATTTIEVIQEFYEQPKLDGTPPGRPSRMVGPLQELYGRRDEA